MTKDYFSFIDNHITQSTESYFDLFRLEQDNNPFILNNSYNTIDSFFTIDKKLDSKPFVIDQLSPLFSIVNNDLLNQNNQYSINEKKFPFTNFSDNELSYKTNIDDSFETSKNGNQELVRQVKEQNEKFEKRILDLIKSEIYESGKVSKIEKYITEECLENDLLFIKQVSLKILHDNLDNPHVIEGILRLFSTKSYDEMSPEAPMCCLSLLSNKSLLVRNKAIEIFEKWNSKKCLKQLEAQKCSPAWVQKHLLNVIDYLKKYGN